MVMTKGEKNSKESKKRWMGSNRGGGRDLGHIVVYRYGMCIYLNHRIIKNEKKAQITTIKLKKCLSRRHAGGQRKTKDIGRGNLTTVFELVLNIVYLEPCYE